MTSIGYFLSWVQWLPFILVKLKFAQKWKYSWRKFSTVWLTNGFPAKLLPVLFSLHKNVLIRRDEPEGN